MLRFRHHLRLEEGVNSSRGTCSLFQCAVGLACWFCAVISRNDAGMHGLGGAISMQSMCDGGRVTGIV